MTLRCFLLVGAILAAPASPAWSWGAVGHEAVCEIAALELRGSEAGDRLDALVARIVADSRFQVANFSISRFADSCVWPDKIKPRRQIDHYVNVPRNWNRIATTRCNIGATCLLSAISGDWQLLRSTSGSSVARLEALMFLGHFVGDIHQPLHVSFKDDQGGNKILEHGPCKYRGANGFVQEEVSLHAVWDACIIRRRLGNDGVSVGLRLQERITRADRERSAADLGSRWDENAMRWADESYKITLKDSVGYCQQQGNTCRYDFERSAYDGGAQKRVDVSNSYINRFRPTVEERLQQAGVRLAAALRAALVPE